MLSAAVFSNLEELRCAADAAPCWEEDGEGGKEVAIGGPGVFEDEVFKDVIADFERAEGSMLAKAYKKVKTVPSRSLEEYLLGRCQLGTNRDDLKRA